MPGMSNAPGILPVNWSSVGDHKILYYDFASQMMLFTQAFIQEANVLYVQDGQDVIEGVRYQTIQDAFDYAKTQSPAYNNKWIVKFTGTNTENLAIPAHIIPMGNGPGSILAGQITSEGGWSTDVLEFLVYCCTLSNIKLTSGKSLQCINCIITTSTPSGGDLALTACLIQGTVNFGSLAQFWTFQSIFFGVLTSITFPATSYIYGMQVAGLFINVYLNGGEFYGCNFSSNTFGTGTYTFKNCSMPGGTISAGRTMTIIGGDFTTLTINGGTVTSYGVAVISRSYIAGVWNNYGDFYDKRTSGMAATEFQAAIDEIEARLDAAGI